MPGLRLSSAETRATIVAVVDDGDAVGHAVGLVHVVRGQEDRYALGLRSRA